MHGIEDMIKRPIKSEVSMPLTKKYQNGKHGAHTHPFRHIHTPTHTPAWKNQSY